MPEIHEHCGVVAVADLSGEDRDTVRIAALLAKRLKHRGQLGAGLAYVRGSAIEVLKGNGPVGDVLSAAATRGLRSPIAIAHTRYATSGSRDPDLAQPFMAHEPVPFALGFNGTVTNYAALRDAKSRPMACDVDTELLRQIAIEQIHGDARTRFQRIFRAMEDQLDGAFNITMMTPNDVAVYRDHRGFHPLSHTLTDGYFIAASEDSAIHSISPHAAVADVAPGQLITASAGIPSVHTEQIVEENSSHCFFEWVYFSHYLSSIAGTHLREARHRFGRLLAQGDMHMPPNQVVVPVPESSIVAAEGYAEERGLLLRHGIHKRRDRRNFIEGKRRKRKARRKYKYDDEGLEDASLIVIDDSLVRGHTSRAVIEGLRKKVQPAEIHLRFACPPILAPCYYGIDFPTTQELLARTHHDAPLPYGELSASVLEALAEDLAVDSVRFLAVEHIARALRIDAQNLCMACVTGEYPTPEGQRLYQLELRQREVKRT